jgi:hypothetical protein
MTDLGGLYLLLMKAYLAGHAEGLRWAESRLAAMAASSASAGSQLVAAALPAPPTAAPARFPLPCAAGK